MGSFDLALISCAPERRGLRPRDGPRPRHRPWRRGCRCAPATCPMAWRERLADSCAHPPESVKHRDRVFAHYGNG
jgi:hypothetical protein